MIWFMAGALTSRLATVPRLVFYHCLEYVQYISSLKSVFVCCHGSSAELLPLAAFLVKALISLCLLKELALHCSPKLGENGHTYYLHLDTEFEEFSF
jgi:hypothetical protein